MFACVLLRAATLCHTIRMGMQWRERAKHGQGDLFAMREVVALGRVICLRRELGERPATDVQIRTCGARPRSLWLSCGGAGFRREDWVEWHLYPFAA